MPIERDETWIHATEVSVVSNKKEREKKNQQDE